MKKLLLILTVALMGCGGFSLDQKDAQATAEKAIKLISERKYDELSELYTNDFKAGESKEVREEKFNQILDAIGPVVSYSLLDSTNLVVTETNELVLKYDVKHSNVETIEEYIISMESGKCEISKINIQQKNL